MKNSCAQKMLLQSFETILVQLKYAHVSESRGDPINDIAKTGN